MPKPVIYRVRSYNQPWKRTVGPSLELVPLLRSMLLSGQSEEKDVLQVLAATRREVRLEISTEEPVRKPASRQAKRLRSISAMFREDLASQLGRREPFRGRVAVRLDMLPTAVDQHRFQTHRQGADRSAERTGVCRRCRRRPPRSPSSCHRRRTLLHAIPVPPADDLLQRFRSSVSALGRARDLTSARRRRIGLYAFRQRTVPV